MRDWIVVAVLVLSFATLLTAHVAIAARLVMRPPRYRGLLALVVVPLAPFWAYENRWRRSFWIWLAAVTAYAIALLLARR